jgi:hypothetical protein
MYRCDAQRIVQRLSVAGAFALLHDLQMAQSFFAGSSHPGAADQVARATRVFAAAAKDFHTAFFDAANGFYGSGLQTEQAMPLCAPRSSRTRALHCTALHAATAFAVIT